MKINKEQLRETLAAKFSDCSAANWDGFDSLAATQVEYHAALELIEELNPEIFQPSITVDFDGTFEFSWLLGERSVFIFRDEKKYILMYYNGEWINEDFDLKEGFPEHVSTLIKV